MAFHILAQSTSASTINPFSDSTQHATLEIQEHYVTMSSGNRDKYVNDSTLCLRILVFKRVTDLDFSWHRLKWLDQESWVTKTGCQHSPDSISAKSIKISGPPLKSNQKNGTILNDILPCSLPTSPTSLAFRWIQSIIVLSVAVWRHIPSCWNGHAGGIFITGWWFFPTPLKNHGLRQYLQIRRDSLSLHSGAIPTRGKRPMVHFSGWCFVGIGMSWKVAVSISPKGSYGWKSCYPVVKPEIICGDTVFCWGWTRTSHVRWLHDILIFRGKPYKKYFITGSNMKQLQMRIS